MSLVEDMMKDDQSQLDSMTDDSLGAQGLMSERFEGTSIEPSGSGVKSSNISGVATGLDLASKGLELGGSILSASEAASASREQHEKSLEKIFQDKKEFDRQKRLRRQEEALRDFSRNGAMQMDLMIRDIKRNQDQRGRVSEAVRNLNESMSSNTSIKDAIRRFASQDGGQ